MTPRTVQFGPACPRCSTVMLAVVRWRGGEPIKVGWRCPSEWCGVAAMHAPWVPAEA